MPIPGSGSPIWGGSMPNYSRSGSDGAFIPEVWSGKLVEKFYDATVLAAISNTDYEGEIKGFGDKVMIRRDADITVANYERGMELPVQKPTTTHVELNIDRAKYFNAGADDCDATQADIKLLDRWGNVASEKIKIAVDTDVLAGIEPDVAATNKGNAAGRISGSVNLGTNAAPFVLNKNTVLDYLVDIGLVLDEASVPETGRFVVLPMWAVAALKKSDLKDASITGDGMSVMRNGRVGMIDRLTVYSSNLLPAVSGKYTIFAGVNAGLTFAAQLTKTERLRSERTFGEIIRGLFVFGFKVVDGTLLASGVIAKS